MSFNSRKKSLFFFPCLIVALILTQKVASAPILPNPVLYLTGTEIYQSSGKQFIRYRYDVFNKTDYPADFFAAAPALPPCGKNTKASRTWVDFFDQGGKRLFGFCALSKPDDLASISRRESSQGSLKKENGSVARLETLPKSFFN